MSNTIPKIVVIGGGAGGLELATQLGHKLGKKKHVDIPKPLEDAGLCKSRKG